LDKQVSISSFAYFGIYHFDIFVLILISIILTFIIWILSFEILDD